MLLARSTARATLAAALLALLHQRQHKDGGGVSGLLPGPRSWARGGGDSVTDDVGWMKVEEQGDRFRWGLLF